MTDLQWDKKLKIQTTGLDEAHADVHHCRYEPTPYAVLQRLADSGYLRRENILVDYGCGKGRVGFFLSHAVGCRTIGIEFNETICRRALENRKSSGAGDRVRFLCAGAEAYEVEDADCFYFFNPFSLEILKSVLGRILESYYGKPRSMRLFFYYPSDAYRTWLMTADFLTFVDEIDCRDLFPGCDPRECILILEIA